MNFKKGDRVLVVDNEQTDRTGQIGIVIFDDRGVILPLNVKFKDKDEDGGTSEWFNHSDLQYAKNDIVKQIINDL